MIRPPARVLLAFCALAGFLPPAAGQGLVAEWIGPAAGDWSNPANWSTGQSPAGGDVVTIDDNPAQDSTVTVNLFTSVDDLTIDVGDSLSVDDFGARALRTSGELTVAPGGDLTVFGPLIIEPTGALRLLPGAEEAELLGVPLGALRWNRGTVAGAGHLQSTGNFFNEGALRADVPGDVLRIEVVRGFKPILLTNQGVVQATGGGELRIDGGRSDSARVVNQYGGSTGRIEAEPGSLVTLNRVVVEGGILAGPLADVTPAGRLEAIDTVLDGVTVEGVVTATRSTLAGQINNAGFLQVVETATIAGGQVELTGGGVVQLAKPETGGFPSQIIWPASSVPVPVGNTLVNHDNTIRGRGLIGLGSTTFVNRGVVESGYGEMELPGASPRELVLDGGPEGYGGLVVNGGVLRAAAGNRLILPTAVTNHDGPTPGLIEAAPDGAVQLNGEIIGGVLRSVPAPAGEEAEPGSIVSYRDDAALSELRLEGAIGDDQSRFSLRGRIEVNQSLEAREIILTDDTHFVGGEMVLGRNGGGLELPHDLPYGAILTLTLEGTTLRLHEGESSGSLLIDNRGAIVASADTQHTVFSTARIDNYGLIHAEADATLVLPEIIAASSEALLRVDQRATIRTSRVIGGTIESASGEGEEPFSGRVVVSGPTFSGATTRVEDVTNRGHLVLERGSIGGVIQNEGLFEIEQQARVGSPFVQLHGDGQLLMRGFLDANPGDSLLNGVGHTIAGSGTLDFGGGTPDLGGGMIINNGEITGALVVRTRSEGAGGYFIQNGVLRSTGDSRLTIETSQPILRNNGLIDAGGREGSIWIIGPTDLINAPGSQIVVDTLLNMIDSGELRNEPGAVIRGSGLIQGGDDLVTSEATRLVNEGVLAPGSEGGDNPAILRLNMDFEQTDAGRLEIDVATLPVTSVYIGQHDLLAINQTTTAEGGDANLAGEVAFNFAPELTPTAGNRIEFLTASFGMVSGRFDHVTGLPALADGLNWRMIYEPHAVSVAVALEGDFNLDGSVDAADYAVWRESLGATAESEGMLAADANGDTLVDSLDFEIWKQNYGATIANFSNLATAPEPATLLLSLLLALVSPFVVRSSGA